MLKDENSMGYLLRQVSKEIKEVCAQASAMSALCLKIFWKSRTMESCVRMVKPSAELELLEDDDDVFVKEIHEKYSARPDTMDDVWLASLQWTIHTIC